VAQIPGRIAELVENFDRNKDFFTSGRYNETQVRREFIDPFFEALGWDVTNTSGYAHAYKDVIHEDAIKVGGWTKAPDYCFRIGGARKFFVEAKKPSIDVKGDPHPGGALSYGAQTSCNPSGLPEDSVFVALPSTTVPCNTNVIVDYAGTQVTAPLKDRGPMTVSDAYWNDDGLPQFPSRAIDLSDGLASDLGMSWGCSGSTPYGGGTVKWRFQ